MDITQLTACALAKKLHGGSLRVTDVLDAYYAAIDEKDGAVGAYIALTKEFAYKSAKAVQARLDTGEIRSPLAGVPVAVKDLICTKNLPTTCASKMLDGFLPPYNATVIEKILAADMIILGKTNMDEFAMGSTTETSYFGATKNPVNPEHVPGGSSGGSAAAVAACLAPIALGSDTGGSIRQPAAYCGVAGLKPTYGAVSRYGLIAYASSLDQIGPIGKTAEDCAALFAIIAGKDERDSTSMDYVPQAASADIAGKKIGIPNEFFGDGLQPEIALAMRQTADELRRLDAVVAPCSLPLIDYAVPTYYIIACAEAASNLSRYDGIKYGHSSKEAASLRETYFKSRSEGFGMEVKRRIMLGNFVLSSGYYDAYYKKALQAKRLIQQAYFAAFEQFDMLLGPVAPTTAPKIGASLDDPLKMYLSDIYTVAINLAGLPALAFPRGADGGHMPIGLQLIGKPFGEHDLFSVANALAAHEGLLG
ncbi:MAG: Asp-tRNA(Asn)/Glu-tRNA(Gln) amidotransferase subunit GatA [Oscillospiraceae bacterium]|jgi:aspartyl-tRNA(Asn)/glutamyl-tRNA(Gln) amidotransferase subunit A|nr:Asp-tRNA(Asn)/Glu-tRNA(Gln) amidotransferase subunit GatA [Oscillospiraceae bacterium]